MVTITGEAVTLVNLIYGTEEGYTVEDMAEAIALAVDIMGFTDDAKADLYSLLAESLTADTKYYLALSIVEDAIIKNKRRFPRG
jgi:hypothetical protein